MTEFKLPPPEGLSPLEVERLARIVKDLEDLATHKKYNKLLFFEAYPKQLEHMEKGARYDERLLMAGNQMGKSECGAAETAYHLTGLYPDDWKGRRFKKPVKAWAAAVSAEAARNISQKKLCGEAGVLSEQGSGFIPKDRLKGYTLGHGATGGYDRVQVEHSTDGIVDGMSILQFKSYEQGREKFQGETLDFIWLDEQPPLDVYTECVARVTATNGMCFITFTNISGGTEVMARFIGADALPQCALTRMSIEDALHIAPEKRADVISKYPPHERDARVYGFPMLGSGKVFTTPVSTILEPKIDDVPPYWPKLWGIDFGIDHPFGAALLAWDRDVDILHVLHCFKIKDAKILQHCAMIKGIAPAVSVAWPQDGTQRDRGSLKPLASLYREQGLRVLPGHATFPDGSVSTEAGVSEMAERFETGRLKVASHLSDFIQEYGVYHRDKGLLVKLNDDILSAIRVAVMMKRFAHSAPVGAGTMRKRAQAQAVGSEESYWGID